MRWLLPACFALSGLSALVYQVVWTRKLTLVFGSTTLAVSICLAVFLAGLAAGAWALARISDRIRRPAMLYAGMEIAIGLFGLASAPLLTLAGPAYTAMAEPIEASPALGYFLEMAIVSLVLAVPTMLMGGTLPVLLAAYRRGEDAAARLPALYAANTFGAGVGAAATGFLLLPMLGLERSLMSAAALNLLAGVLVAIGARRLAAPAGSLAQPASPDLALPHSAAEEMRLTRAAEWAVLAVVFGSGFSTLLHEVLWTRTLELVLGNSTRAFSLMLAVFLVGLGGGVAIAGWLVRRGRASLVGLALVQGGIGVAAFLTSTLLQQGPTWFLLLWEQFHTDPARMALAQIGLLAAVLLWPTLLMGMVFPLAVALRARHGAAAGSGDVGRLYALNTLGNILGTVLAAIAFVPILGLHVSLLVGGWLNLGLAALLSTTVAVGSPRRRWAMSAAPLVAGLVLTAVVPRWDPMLMTGGVYFTARSILDMGLPRFRAMLSGLTLQFYKEGPSGIVTVTGTPDGGRTLKIDGRAEANLQAIAQVLLGHIPFMSDRAINDVFITGFGSGTTTGMVTMYPVRSIEVVDLERGVIDASHLFEAVNRKPLEDPRVHVRTADARNVLYLKPDASLDLVISQPSYPWVSGASKLFTVEYYDLARRRLRPGGLFAQWVQLYNMDFPAVRTLLRTFTSVFPETLAFEVGGGSGEILLLGSTAPLTISWPSVQRIFSDPTRVTELSRVALINEGALLSNLVLGPNEVNRLLATGALNTDDNGLLEFSTALSLYEDTTDANRTTLRRLAIDPWTYVSDAPPVAARGTVYVQMARHAGGIGNYPRSLKFAEEAVKVGGGADAYQMLGDILYLERPEEAVAAWRTGLTLAPGNAEILTRLLDHFSKVDPDRRPAEFAQWERAAAGK